MHFVVHFWLLMAWIVFRSAILYDLLLLGVGPCWIMGLPSPSLFCIHFVALLAFPPYHYVIPAVMLFDSILVGLFGLAVCFPPIDSVCSLGLFLHCLRALESHFPLGHPWPICFPWASSAFFQSYFLMGLY